MTMTTTAPSEGTQPRIKAMLEAALPDEGVRKATMELFAYAIENADEERSSAWLVTETRRGIVLTAGRLFACSLGRGVVEISVMGPISDETRASLGAETRQNEAWKAVPGGLLLRFSADKSAVALGLLKDPFDKFVDAAMDRVHRSVSLESHVPQAVAYVASVVGRDLPQPSAATAEEEDDREEDDGDAQPASREPKVRGRAPIFEHSQRSIASLVEDVERRVIALPDMQRPFVWEDTKVRDLLDSLFVGFPVGTLVLWHTSDGKDAHAVGGPSEGLRASTLVIDGQQRLTSLYAVMKGVDVVEKDGERRRITIAFRPRDGKFEVADAAIRRDPEFLPNVTDLWKPNAKSKAQIRRELLQNLRTKRSDIDDAYENAVDLNLDRAHGIADYRFPVVEIRKTANSEEVPEEDVADIFVRINNQGTRLGQADFVLTLLSVFHGKLRDRIEARAHEMSQEAIVPVDTQQLLRAACGVGFGRARMAAVYRYLRGVDATTGDTSLADRKTRLETLDLAAEECVDQTRWRDYNLRVMQAGFVNSSLVASTNAIVNAYAFYVLGQRAGVAKPRLDELVSRWLFGSLLTARYSTSSETKFEEDLGRARDASPRDADTFVQTMDVTLAETLTGDYWTHGVVRELATQRGRAPAALAFRAAQIVLGARALFSDQPLQNLLAPPGKGKRAASEAHHIFPKGWLMANGITERKRINQVANFADVGWYENATIGALRPRDYVPRLRDTLRIDDDRWGRMCAEHALPVGWEMMEYETFLSDRRIRMAEVIRAAYRKLGGEADAAPLTPPWFLPGTEVVWGRIVETERALRALVRSVYGARFGAEAPAKIEAALGEKERESLVRALRARPAGADPLSVVDYLYLAQLPVLLFVPEVWQHARERVSGDAEAKHKLQAAIQQIVPVRNEIAHVRDVGEDRLLRASLACKDVLGMVGA